MAEAKSPRKKTVAAKPSAASPTKKPAPRAKAAPAKAAPARATAAKAPPAKAAPARATPAKAAPAKAAPARAAAGRSAAAKPAGRAAKPTRAPTHEEIVARKERKTNAALRVAKRSGPPRTGAKKAAVEAKPAPSKKPTTGAKKPAGTKKPAAAKTPRKRPELSASTPDAAAQRRDGARELAKLVAAAGLDKKAERIEIIDIGEKVDYADFLVLMSGRSDRQVRAVADGVVEVLREQGHRPGSIEGMQQGQWVLVDYTDVIVHVFVDEARRYYDLEGLWMDATRVPFEGTATEA